MKAIFISTLLLAFSFNANAGFIDFEDTTDSGWYQSDIQSGDYQFDKKPRLDGRQSLQFMVTGRRK